MNNVKLIQAKDFQSLLYNPTCIIPKQDSVIEIIAKENPLKDGKL